MSALHDILRRFTPAELARWDGLPAELPLGDLDGPRGEGRLGTERVPALWTSVPSDVFAGGLRVWHEGSVVLAIEGRDPTGLPPASDLGEPEAQLDTYLGRLRLEGGERVYPARGLALRVNPENGVLLGAIGFVPTSAGDYGARVRPEVGPQRLLPKPAALESES
jgi:hypothetical protein